MNELLRTLTADKDYSSVLSGIRAGMKEQMISGLAGSARPLFIASLFQEMERPLVVLTHNLFSAQKIADDLQELLPEHVLLYPANELMVTEMATASPELLAQRIEVMSKLCDGFTGIVVMPYAGVRKLIPDAYSFADALLRVQVGDQLPMDHFLTRLHQLGFERTDRVERKGEMSVRGGIVDFYPITSSHPYRIEWFDDEIDSIRTFDATDQRSIEKCNDLVILPCKEMIADERRFKNAAQHAAELLQAQLDKMTERKAKEALSSHIGEEIEKLRQMIYFDGIYKYISLFYPEQKTILDFIPKDAVMLIDEPIRLLDTSKQLDRDEVEMQTHLLQEGKFLPAFKLAKAYESLLPYSGFQKLYLSLFLRQVPQTQPQNIVNFVCRAMQNFHGQMHVLKSEMERWRKLDTRIVILANGEDRISKVHRVLEDYKIDAPEIMQGNLQSGFEWPSIRLVVITEGEIFSQKQRKARKLDKKMENVEKIKSYLDLKVGDYVVHISHGIGKYMGIGTLEVGGIHKDYMHILYAGGDKLSIPIDQIELVQKYVGGEEKEPKLYKLGGSEWARVKAKARSSVRDIADELIKLYADRQATVGYSFSKDTPYQKDFEAMFPYEETVDQTRSIEEIKRNMEQPYPMDRLLCGDVGYGKTEVAIRAAFKAAIEGKQVAVLVPTTILAQQHFETFSERFAGYPMSIQVLSRFRSKKQQADTIKGIKSGAVDIVIGTHRLLSADIQFKELGLLIVDEEQRFGVSHKEKLKRLKLNVDVLTLTATPIPRTLHMSMLGVRDLSVIETPPENRFPVQTYVLEHSNALTREAIERELARDGQVYYLFNRVQGIYQMAEQISQLVPDARIAVAHGQMAEQELERTILDFLDGEYDVLVSTSIIETGVDIPNVNTLIVHDADKMGLSQLYQLRGRVGRSNRIAYAYFTYQRDKVLSETAEKRLHAIKEFTELGSGFKIAMRDLTIRGAGNLLGAEQHGFIASVGFDLYTQMLTEEISKRKSLLNGDEQAEIERVQTLIDLQIDAYLPSDYIYDSMQKIEVYKKVAHLRSLEEVDEIHDELVDRFGDLPQAVIHLLDVGRLKVYGAMYAIESIIRKSDDVHIKILDSQNEVIDGQKLFALASTLPGKMKFIDGPSIHIVLQCKGLSSQQMMELLGQFMQQYQSVLKTKGVLMNVAK